MNIELTDYGLRVNDTEFFSVADTLECGQVFRYNKISEIEYTVCSNRSFARLITDMDGISIYTTEPSYFVSYFDLSTNYRAINARIADQSGIIAEAALASKGVRILKADLVEIIISFIISANNNIARIRKTIERLCTDMGERLDGYYAFPTLETLASKGAGYFMSVGCGYRAPYIVSTVNSLLANYNLNSLLSMTTEQARQKLVELKGVGRKVADCILLFGLNRGDVFPTDTWIEKVYHEYFESGIVNPVKISDYLVKTFGVDSGLVQQYLFHYRRNIVA